MNWLNSFVDRNDVTVIMISVLGLFLGLALAMKMDTKWGYVIAALAGVLCLYTLKVNGIFNL